MHTHSHRVIYITHTVYIGVSVLLAERERERVQQRAVGKRVCNPDRGVFLCVVCVWISYVVMYGIRCLMYVLYY